MGRIGLIGWGGRGGWDGCVGWIECDIYDKSV